MRMNIMAAASVAILALACAGDTQPPEGEATAEAAAAESGPRQGLPFTLTARQERGQETYRSHCWSCHGDAGRGDGPAPTSGAVPRPPDLLSGGYPRMTVAELEHRFEAAIEEGAATHPHMQAVTSLVGVEGFKDALAYVAALVYPPDVPGSALHGKEIYEFRCVVCHGSDGRGDGSAVEFLGDIRPADFTSDTLIAARNFNGLFARVKEGGRMHESYMPAWGVMYSDEDIWDLVAFISAFQAGVLSPPPQDGSGT